jgi:hypothetical protein
MLLYFLHFFPQELEGKLPVAEFFPQSNGVTISHCWVVNPPAACVAATRHPPASGVSGGVLWVRFVHLDGFNHSPTHLYKQF